MARPDARGLLLVVLLALVAAVAALLPSATPLRMLLALPLALVLPGYALSMALLPGRIGSPERLTLTVGLSLAAASLGGLALNWTPWGLRTVSWAALLAAITVSAAVGAYMRRSAPRVAVPPSFSLRRRDALLGAGATLVVVAAFAVARSSAARQPVGFTQLWLLPGAPGTGTVRLGVDSRELTPVTYRLTLEQGGTVKQWPAITLAPGAAWQRSVTLPAKVSTPVVVNLYREGSATPYRHVQLSSGGQP